MIGSLSKSRDSKPKLKLPKEEKRKLKHSKRIEKINDVLRAPTRKAARNINHLVLVVHGIGKHEERLSEISK